MGALTTFDDNNKVILSGKVTWIEKKTIYGKWVWAETDETGKKVIFETDHVACYTRFTNYSYKYVGMDFDTAKRCRTRLQNLFTRQLKYSVWQDTGEFKEESGGMAIMTDVTMQDDNGLWTVLVQVHEQDSEMRRVRQPSWGWLSTREYDL